jgi:hypothetical protein
MTGRALSPERRTLSPKRLTTVCHLLGKGSDHDAEVASALRKADEIVREAGLSWHDIVAAARVQKPKPSPRAKKTKSPNQPDMGASCQFDDMPSWRDACERILAAGATSWEQNFCRQLLDKWHGPLTGKQAACLSKIFMLRAAGFAERRRRA